MVVRNANNLQHPYTNWVLYTKINFWSMSLCINIKYLITQKDLKQVFLILHNVDKMNIEKGQTFAGRMRPELFRPSPVEPSEGLKRRPCRRAAWLLWTSKVFQRSTQKVSGRKSTTESRKNRFRWFRQRKWQPYKNKKKHAWLYCLCKKNINCAEKNNDFF